MASRLFDQWSRVYDQPLVQRAVYRPVHDAVEAALRAARPTSVLDVGCGTGLLTARLATSLPGVWVAGCEPSAGMVGRAAERDAPVRWVRGVGERLPVRSASVDAVVSTDSFHWIPDQAAALREFARVLRPGGRVFIAVLTSPTRALREVTSSASRLTRQPLRWPTAAELAHGAEAAGLTVERQSWIGRGVPTFPFVTRLTVARA